VNITLINNNLKTSVTLRKAKR